jgi:hypothetical protein
MAINQRRRSGGTATQSSSFDANKAVPPDIELQALARRIREEANIGRVDFFGVQGEYGEVIWSVIYQDGPRRATVQLQARPQDDDVAGISTALRAWAKYREDGSVYTTEVPVTPPSEWS